MKIAERNKFDTNEFLDDFVDKRPVIYKSYITDWTAVKKWTPDYFAETCPTIEITTKCFDNKGISTRQQEMHEYVDLLRQYKALREKDPDVVAPYCHDVPIFLLAEKLKNDIDNFPVEIMPSWYADSWWKFAQFFMSSKNSVTPLHFDTLLTSNIFFQIRGKKLFTIHFPKDEKNCYRKNWRWFEVDPENIDLSKNPKYENTDSHSVMVEAGDMLYMPPETIHHVRSLEDSISFNVDFHTRKSCARSFKGLFKGMPAENVRYNLLCLRALFLGDPSKTLFNRYSGYLNYVS